jgi:hypothetical protein
MSRTLLLLLLLLPIAARAADATAPDDDRTILARQVLELAYSPENLRTSFIGFLEPALDAMKNQGMPDAARTEMRKASTQWFDEEIKWADIEPTLIKIYATDFSVEELRTLLAFLQKPLGQKVIAKLPLVIQDGSLAGQQYFLSKKESLNARLAPIYEKYKSQATK